MLNKKIKIDLLNDTTKEKICTLIQEIQKKSRIREINYLSIKEVCKELNTYFHRLGIPKKYMNDITVYVDYNNNVFPKSYKGIPESTHFTLVYKNGFWYIVDMSRNKTSTDRYYIVYPEITKQYIIDKTLKNIEKGL